MGIRMYTDAATNFLVWHNDFMAPQDLLDLARFVSDPGQDMCILAEGNVSCLEDDDCFWVKGSGQEMGTMGLDGFSKVNLARLRSLFGKTFDNDVAIRNALNETLLEGPAPSTETFMHGALLRDGVRFVAHMHPTPLLSLLCLPDAEMWAGQRLFPDEIVCCGPATCWVPYAAPGYELAELITRRTDEFDAKHGVSPKLYWLQNHGIVVVGATAREVVAGCSMAVKAGRVLLGALQTGRGPVWLTSEQVNHIYNWPDEHARQRALFGR